MRVVVAMSGGVDSSVAALLLQEQGFEVIGVTMRLVDCDAGPSARVPSCCGRQAIRDAQRVAAELGFPHYVLDFREKLETEVIQDFCDEYARGRTPNPCVRCNERLKFRLLLDQAKQLGAVKLATGHYARVEQDGDGVWRLSRAKDKEKDQSYFLYRLTQEQMARVLLPLGGCTKQQVRETARREGLAVAEKRESQEICFVPNDDYAAFLRQRRPELFRPGRVVDTEGRELGRHEGVAHFTVGQRKGLGIALGERWYVVRLEPENNVVVLGKREEALSSTAELEHVHWVSGREPAATVSVVAKIRYRHPGGPAVVVLDGSRARVSFAEPQWAITPGQAMVFYQDDIVLGGGVIRKSGRVVEWSSGQVRKG